MNGKFANRLIFANLAVLSSGEPVMGKAPETRVGMDSWEDVPHEGTNNDSSLGNNQSHFWFSGFSLAFIRHRGTNSLTWDLNSKTSTHTLARLSNWHPKDFKRFGILLSSCSLATKKIVDLPESQGAVSWDVKWHPNDRHISFSPNSRFPENYAITLSGTLTITTCLVYFIRTTSWTPRDRSGSGSTGINRRPWILNLPGIQITEKYGIAQVTW
jgi:hypothetical protein